MDITGAIGAIGASIQLVKDLKEIDASFDKAELKLKIAELTSALADAKLGLTEIGDTLRQKDAEIASLKEHLTQRDAKTAIHNNRRYFVDGEGQPTGAPLCSICERSGYLLTLVQDRSKGISGITYCCPKCKANFGPFVGVIRQPSN